VAFFVDGKVIAAPAFHVVKVFGVFNAPFSHFALFYWFWAAKLLKKAIVDALFVYYD
jgi:hypothetical protein